MELTRIDPEERCRDFGQFRRQGTVFHRNSGALIRVAADIPDTFFSIPAVTKTEHGFVTCRNDEELEFVPHTNQRQMTIAAYRKRCRRK